ncbi:MAG: hypothetical protein ACR2GR_06960 [Rhodothermales bacterium]
MQKPAFALTVLLIVCSAQTQAQDLQEGTWTGTLTPMNHPERATPLTYDVRHAGDSLTITFALSDLPDSVVTRDITLTADTLSFAFNEPEADVLLRCALGRQEDQSYAGRCADAEGKWAAFTMVPPE